MLRYERSEYIGSIIKASETNKKTLQTAKMPVILLVSYSNMYEYYLLFKMRMAWRGTALLTGGTKATGMSAGLPGIFFRRLPTPILFFRDDNGRTVPLFPWENCPRTSITQRFLTDSQSDP